MEVSCPVSVERVNENVVRLVAFLVALIAICCLVFSNYWAIVFLMFDFGIRAFTTRKLSPLKYVAIKLAKVLSLPQQMTDLAPKKFAATLGLIFCLLITAMFLFNFPTLAMALTMVMIGFALLESLFAICVGCHVYSFLQMFKSNKE
jgi:sterol desaturase/sphingolipid hydroxylase (fatty acid hydroxylase superfamily)